MTHAPATQSTPVDARLVATAVEAAKAAGETLVRCRNEDLAVDRFLPHDIKLKADRLAEEAVFDVIRSATPKAHILSEESGRIDGSGDYVWIVDPLDGTLNYFHRQHHFCTCIACYRRTESEEGAGISRLGEPLVGVVYAVDYDELYVATHGESPTCNGLHLATSGITSLSEAVVSTSFGSDSPTMAHMERFISRLIRSVHKVRIQGSCGLDICHVAAGRLSGHIQSGVRVWDFAASRIILEGAGGRFQAAETEPNRWTTISAAPGLFEALALVKDGS